MPLLFFPSDRFKSPVIEQAARRAINLSYGQGWEDNRYYRLDAFKFFSTVCGYKVLDVSLARLKTDISAYHGSNRLHRPMFYFLASLQEKYVAHDSDAFRELMPVFVKAGRSYRILFNDDVMSFRHVAYCRYFKTGFFCIVRSSHCFLLEPYRRFISDNKWTTSDKPTQEHFDDFFALVDRAVSDRAINSISEFDQPLFFDLVDLAGRRGDSRDRLIHYIIWFFRFGIKYLGIRLMNGPIVDSRVLSSPETMSYFLSSYQERTKTFQLVSRNRYQNSRLVNLDIDNHYLRFLYGGLLSSGTVTCEGYNACRDTLVSSLGEFSTVDGSYGNVLNEQCLFAQMDFYREVFIDRPHRSEAIAFIKAFYLYVDDVSDGAFFKNARMLTYGLLTSKRFILFIDEGYSFRDYNPYDHISKADGDRIVFILRGFNTLSRTLLKEDYISVDYTTISDPFYRNLAWRVTTSTRGRLCRKSLPCTLRLFLEFLSSTKRRAFHPTPELASFSVWDAILTVEYFESQTTNDVTYNNWVMNVRDFLRWAAASKSMIVDPVCFMLLHAKKIKQLPCNRPVLSDDELTTLTKYFTDRASGNPVYSQALILLHLCAITPIRIGHACSILKEELVYDSKLGSYILTSTSKSTRGGIGEIVLGGKADKLIRKAVAISDRIGLACPQEDLRKQVFLYRQDGNYSVFTARKFSKMLSEACEACHLPHYTTRNLRATYMTKAYIEASEQGEANDYLLKLFSYHRSNDTTLEHYVNHNEALAELTEHLKKGNDWAKTIYPDEIAALNSVIDEYNELIAGAEDEDVKFQLMNELRGYEKQLEEMRS